MIALVWCYKMEDFLDENIQKIKIKKHGRWAISVFKYGLDYLSNFFLQDLSLWNRSFFVFLLCT